MKPSRKSAYHHGDLKDALVDATRDIIEREGLTQFTMRESARRAGVSHGAPAHHFGDKTGLLTELAARSFEERRELAQRYMAEAGDAPAEKLKAMGLAYIDYSVANRGVHELVSRSDQVDWDSPRLACASQATTDELVAAMSAVTGETLHPSKEANPSTLLAWSVVHGFAALVNEGKILRDVPEAERPQAAHRLAEQVLGLLDIMGFARPK